MSCEGYYAPDDPYVLAGSCGLEYTLRFSEHFWEQVKEHREKTLERLAEEKANEPAFDLAGVKYLLLLAAVAIFIAWATSRKKGPRQQQGYPQPSAPPMEEPGHRGYPAATSTYDYTAQTAVPRRTTFQDHNYNQQYPTHTTTTAPSFAENVAASVIGNVVADRFFSQQQTPTSTPVNPPSQSYIQPTHEPSIPEPKLSGETHKSTAFGSTSRR